MSRSRDYVGDIPVEIADRIMRAREKLAKPVMRYCPICKRYVPSDHLEWHMKKHGS